MMPVSETTPDTESSAATGTGTGTETSSETKAETKKAVKPEVKANPELVTLIKNYEDAAEKAQTYYVDMINFIKKNSISRAVLVRTLVEARQIEIVSASSEASRILKIAKDDEVFNQLAAGEITLRVARQATQKKREASPAAATAGTAEQKTKAYEDAVQALAKAAKALGFDVKSVLANVKATLQADPYNLK